MIFATRALSRSSSVRFLKARHPPCPPARTERAPCRRRTPGTMRCGHRCQCHLASRANQAHATLATALSFQRRVHCPRRGEVPRVVIMVVMVCRVVNQVVNNICSGTTDQVLGGSLVGTHVGFEAFEQNPLVHLSGSGVPVIPVPSECQSQCMHTHNGKLIARAVVLRSCSTPEAERPHCTIVSKSDFRARRTPTDAV